MRAPEGSQGSRPRPAHMGGGRRGTMGRGGRRPLPPRGGMHMPPPPRRSALGGFLRRPLSCMGCLVCVLGAGAMAKALKLLL